MNHHKRGSSSHTSKTGTAGQPDFISGRYQDLIESTNDWLWEIDENLHYTYASPQVFHILGYRPDEIIGKTPFDFIRKKEAKRVLEIFQPLVKQRRKIHLLVNINRHKQGHDVYLETSGKPFYDSDHRFRGYRGIDRDITERKKLETEKTNYLEMLSQIADAALILDKNAQITYVNDTFSNLFGYSSDEIIRQPISKLNPSSNSFSPDTELTIRELQDKGSWQGETKRTKKDGSELSVYLKAKAIRGNDGDIEGYLGTYIDLTPFKQAESKLLATLEATIRAISSTVEKRDPYTFGHQNNVARLSIAIAKVLVKDNDFIKGLEMGALIHDIGKIYIPSEILNRPGTLSKHERKLIQTHPQVGYDIVKDIDFPWPVAQMILQHHERINGRGYPRGLKEDQIIPEAKIIAVADVLEATSSHRPYRPARELSIGLEELKKNRGSLYDPDIVDACIYLFEEKGFQL